MVALLAFSLTLLAAVLVSALAHRSVLSTAVMFLGVGVLLGDGALGLVTPAPDNPVVSRFAEVALFSVLFTDGMRMTGEELRRAWRLPGRALLLGLPITLVVTAGLARYLLGFDWLQALVIGAALSPTDPVFAEALIGRQEVPQRLRHLLNVESGLNDGLALPFVVVPLTVLSAGEVHGWSLAGDVAMGVALGVGLAYAAVRLEQVRIFAAASRYEPLMGFAIALVVFSIASLLHGNEFLAAFAAGVTVATAGPKICEQFQVLGTSLAEVLKLAALLVFGTLLSPVLLADVGSAGVLFAVLVLVAARPVAIVVSLLGSRVAAAEQAAAAWFGPKGFASAFFGMLVLHQGAPSAERIFHVIAIVVALSIVVHSTTDVLVARWFARRAGAEAGPGGSAEAA